MFEHLDFMEEQGSGHGGDQKKSDEEKSDDRYCLFSFTRSFIYYSGLMFVMPTREVKNMNTVSFKACHKQ